MPKIILEAAAAGRPIVPSDTPGSREVISDGVEGILVPPADSKALAAALRRLIERPRERADMGAAGRERAIKDMDVDQVVARTIEIYRELRSTNTTLSH